MTNSIIARALSIQAIGILLCQVVQAASPALHWNAPPTARSSEKHKQSAPTMIDVGPLPAPATVEDEVRELFGEKITDHYSWMEKGTGDKRFIGYLKSQGDYTQTVLQSLGSARDKLLARIRELDTATSNIRLWQHVGGKIFYLETAAGSIDTYLMVRDETGIARRLFDPGEFSTANTHAAIDYYSPSFDGRYVVVGVSQGGSEDSTLVIVDVQSAKTLPERITRTQYADPSWREDSKSFYYARLQELAPNVPKSAIYENERVYLHTLGNNPDDDPAVFGTGVNDSLNLDKSGFVGISTAPESQFVLAYHSAGTSDHPSIYLARGDEAVNNQAKFTLLISRDDMLALTQANIALHGSTMYALMEKGTRNRKLIAIDLNHPDLNTAKVIVADSDRVLLGVHAASDALYVTSKQGIKFFLQRLPYSSNARLEDIQLPYAGSISNVNSHPSVPGVIFRLESWTASGQALRYNPDTKVITNTQLVPQHRADFSSVEAREVCVKSKDGTLIPISIICKKDTQLDSTHPTIEVGYGAYGISVDPNFDPALLSWIERNGVIAVVHARGGGEFGERWHQSGMKSAKQHTIDDMVAAANYLIENKYTSPSYLAIKGTSAGGIACGGAITQHPDLFSVAIDNVGMTDMLRFQSTPGGAANIPEFGDINEAQGFKDLYAMSPYHHIKRGTKYPAVLGITGVNDPRVPSWIVAKFVAALQAATASNRPILLRVDFDAGHGLGSTRLQRQQQMADEHSFIHWQTGDPEFQPQAQKDAFEN